MDQGYLDVQAVRRILAAGSGDAALLYLCRTCGLSDVVTGFSEARLTEAERLLSQSVLNSNKKSLNQVSLKAGSA